MIWSSPQSVLSYAFLVTAPLMQTKGSEGTAHDVAGASVEKHRFTFCSNKDFIG